MNAAELYRTGSLTGAIEAQIQNVKNRPADQNARMFLFELLAFTGDWDRAQKHIEIIKFPEMELLAAVDSYRKLLDSERIRARVFSEGIAPKFIVDPPEHLTLRLEALQQLRGGNAAAAKEIYARAEAAAPAFSGKVNDKPCDLFRDCDDRFGPVLEVMTLGSYFWAPLDQVEELTVTAPKYPRDLVWISGHLKMRNGPEGDVFLPVRYPGSTAHAEPKVQLGRMTDWSADDPVCGVGARLFLCGDDPLPLTELRSLFANA